MKWLVFVLLVGFVSAVEVELDCPDEIFVDEEFECEVEVFDGDGVYDLKVDVDGERNSVLRILDSGDWKSSYYYLTEFVRDDEVVGLKILSEGRYDVILKLRQGSEREEFDVGRIKVLKGKEVERTLVEEEEDVGTDYADLGEKGNGVILLGGDVAGENGVLYGHGSGEPEWDYVSKDGKISDLLLYGFCLFLILFIVVLMWGR